MRLYRIRIDIYEPAAPYPIVTHFFTGRTRAEARRYHLAHRRADRFLRECEDKGLYDKQVRCRAVRKEGWAGSR